MHNQQEDQQEEDRQEEKKGMKGRRFFGQLIIAPALFLVLGISGCQSQPKRPQKIARLNSLSTKPDGARVEFFGWINAVEGDKDVGIELFMTEAPNSYPQATVELKDGQTPPEKDQERCVSAQIVRRDDFDGGVIFRLKEAELIDCY